ncbi:MAG TPA: ATP-binding protein [Chitinophagaceae bacterium]|nr:ATP-binding protein [Chitinophagaceae bacterium]
MSLASFYKKNKLAIATWAYWILLLYIIAALIWWFVELNQQNNEMYLFKKELLSPQDPNYQVKLNFIEEEQKTNVTQYLGEGITFFALMVLGAIYVYRAVRRQIRLNEQQQNFMMAVTHELKTPIAITRLNLETLQKRKLDSAQQEKIIDISLQENARLNDLCENILLVTRMDSGHYMLHPEQLDLSALLHSSVSNLRARFPKREIKEQISAGTSFTGDALLIQLLFNNLIENAIKYSPADKAVEVRLKNEGGRIRFELIDQGIGIPDAEKKRVFQKFYRSGHENTRSTKGTGLGLYLSQKIAEDHNTAIEISDNHPTGSIFTIEF